jgi:hypothetical protein
MILSRSKFILEKHWCALVEQNRAKLLSHRPDLSEQASSRTTDRHTVGLSNWRLNWTVGPTKFETWSETFAIWSMWFTPDPDLTPSAADTRLTVSGYLRIFVRNLDVYFSDTNCFEDIFGYSIATLTDAFRILDYRFKDIFGYSFATLTDIFRILD